MIANRVALHYTSLPEDHQPPGDQSRGGQLAPGLTGAGDAGMPGVADIPDVEYVRAADEHGRLILHDPGRTLPLGSKVRLVPGHCDPTVNLYDWYVCYRNGRVEALWPITARGALL